MKLGLADILVIAMVIVIVLAVFTGAGLILIDHGRLALRAVILIAGAALLLGVLAAAFTRTHNPPQTEE